MPTSESEPEPCDKCREKYWKECKREDPDCRKAVYRTGQDGLSRRAARVRNITLMAKEGDPSAVAWIANKEVTNALAIERKKMRRSQLRKSAEAGEVESNAKLARIRVNERQQYKRRRAKRGRSELETDERSQESTFPDAYPESNEATSMLKPLIYDDYMPSTTTREAQDNPSTESRASPERVANDLGRSDNSGQLSFSEFIDGDLYGADDDYDDGDEAESSRQGQKR